MRVRSAAFAILSLMFFPVAYTQNSSEQTATSADAAQQQFVAKIKALNWVRGPTSQTVANNSTLLIPEHYVFLDAANTAKFEELNQNLSYGKEVLVAPQDLSWSAYLQFSEEGYVKDDEKIDAAGLLSTLKENTEKNNVERKKRGWDPFHIVDWATPPAYNNQTKRLEWATLYESNNERGTNFSTKILGRRGFTTVVMVAGVESLAKAEAELNEVLKGYTFSEGEKYAQWVPGDKVAEYGLAALIVGGAAAVATKKGFWAVIASALAAGWKIAAAAVVGAGAWLRNLFKKKA